MAHLSTSSGSEENGSRLLAELSAALKRGWGSQQTIRALRQSGLANDALSLLRTTLSDSAPRTRAEACLALDYLADPAAIGDLRPLLFDRDTMVSVRAADALCRLGESAAALLPRLIEILSEPEPELPIGKNRVQPPCMMLQMPETRYHAARVLAYLGTEAAPARQPLTAAMESASAIVRAAAATALAGIGESSDVYIPPLRQALHDVNVQSSRERVWAAETLIELGESPGNVVPVLAELVHDEDWTGALRAIRLLRELGSAAASAIPALRAATESQNKGIAEEAATTLRQIEVPDSDCDPAELDTERDQFRS